MLGNAYKEYCAAEEDKRERVIRHWVRNWFSLLRDMPEDFEDVRPDLLPIVRSRSHFELNQLRSVVESGTPISWPYVPLGEHFGVALVYDLPDAMRSIPQANLDAWGLTLYEALEIARENLATLPAKFIGPQSGDGVYLSATGDNYDASRILSPELIGQFQVQGDPVAMIANRDNLIVAGADDDAGLEAMLKMAAEALEQLRPISSVAVRYRRPGLGALAAGGLASLAQAVPPAVLRQPGARLCRAERIARPAARQDEPETFRGHVQRRAGSRRAGS